MGAQLSTGKVWRSALMDTAMTAMLLYGLVLFAVQPPTTALVVIAVLAVIHIGLLEACVPAGLFSLVWSRPGLHWMEDHGL
jgi:hypothetical protein